MGRWGRRARFVIAVAVMVAATTLIGGGAFGQEDTGEESEDTELVEPGPVPRDQVVNEDLIVRGNACVGSGSCTDGMIFSNQIPGMEPDLIISGPWPIIHLNDTSDAPFGGDFTMSVNSNAFVIWDEDGGQTNRLVIQTDGPTTLNGPGGNPTSLLFLDSQVRLSSPELRLNSTAVGLGDFIGSPEATLHVRTQRATLRVTDAGANVVPQTLMRLENNGPVIMRLVNMDSGEEWRVTGGGSFLSVGDGTNKPLLVEAGAPSDTLVLSASGNIGVGTDTPSAPLTVAGDAARINVERTGPVASRTLLDMSNDGRVFFRIQDRTQNDGWQFGTRAGGFEVNMTGSGGSEFRFFDTGRVTMGPGPITNFELSPTGDLEVGGTITDGSGNTLGNLAADNQALKDQVADLEARLAALEEALAQLAG